MSKSLAQISMETGDTIAVFPSISKAAYTIFGEHATITAKICDACKGRIKSAYGFKWQYWRLKDETPE